MKSYFLVFCVFILSFLVIDESIAQCDGLSTGTNNRNGGYTMTGDCYITGNVVLDGNNTRDLTIPIGTSLIIDGDFTNSGQGTVTVEVGGYLEVTGTYSSTSNSANPLIVFLGEVVVGEDFLVPGQNTPITVSGILNVTGTIEATGGNGSLTVDGGGLVKANAVIVPDGQITVNDGGTLYGVNGITSNNPVDVGSNNTDQDCANNCCGDLCNTGGDALDNTGQELLPVTLISFQALKKPTSVNLIWQTASELNNDFFTLEKSFDGINFSELCNIEGAGSTNELNSYQYHDVTHPEAVYYRLSQTDYDGTHELLSAIRIGEGSVNPTFSLYPNPLVNTRRVRINGVTSDMYWQVYSLSGQVLLESDFLSDFSIDLSCLKSGVYLVKVSNQATSFSQRIILK